MIRPGLIIALSIIASGASASEPRPERCVSLAAGFHHVATLRDRGMTREAQVEAALAGARTAVDGEPQLSAAQRFTLWVIDLVYESGLDADTLRDVILERCHVDDEGQLRLAGL
jgi:hypothetical protein